MSKLSNAFGMYATLVANHEWVNSYENASQRGNRNRNTGKSNRVVSHHDQHNIIASYT